jgi:putative protease
MQPPVAAPVLSRYRGLIAGTRTESETEENMAEEKVGVVTHYFGKIGVAAVKITDGELNVGDTIHVQGHTSDFTQTVDSIQMEHESVGTARPGDEVGIKVVEYAREHDTVYRVTPE